MAYGNIISKNENIFKKKKLLKIFHETNKAQLYLVSSTNIKYLRENKNMYLQSNKRCHTNM